MLSSAPPDGFAPAISAQVSSTSVSETICELDVCGAAWPGQRTWPTREAMSYCSKQKSDAVASLLEGCLAGHDPATSCSTDKRSADLSYRHHSEEGGRVSRVLFLMVISLGSGLEPAAPSPRRLLSTFGLDKQSANGRIGDCCGEDCPFHSRRVAADGLWSLLLSRA